MRGAIKPKNWVSMVSEEPTKEQLADMLRQFPTFGHAAAHYRSRFERALYLAEHLFEMIPRQVWRDQGAEHAGMYEGDHWAVQTYDELYKMRQELENV